MQAQFLHLLFFMALHFKLLESSVTQPCIRLGLGLLGRETTWINVTLHIVCKGSLEFM